MSEILPIHQFQETYDDYINHQCDPNLETFLSALNTITEGTPIKSSAELVGDVLVVRINNSDNGAQITMVRSRWSTEGTWKAAGFLPFTRKSASP